MTDRGKSLLPDPLTTRLSSTSRFPDSLKAPAPNYSAKSPMIQVPLTYCLVAITMEGDTFATQTPWAHELHRIGPRLEGHSAIHLIVLSNCFYLATPQSQRISRRKPTQTNSAPKRGDRKTKSQARHAHQGPLQRQRGPRGWTFHSSPHSRPSGA